MNVRGRALKNILIIGFVWPEPNSSAAGSRMLQLIDCFLAEGAKITFASAAADSEFMFDVRQLGIAPGAKVRVGACLNESGINPQATGCASVDGPDRIEVFGPVTRVR